MRIGHSAHPQVFRTFIGAIPLGEADEEALLRREPIQRLKILVFGGIFPGYISQNLAAKIGHVFTQRKLAVDVDVIYDNKACILVLNTLGPLLEFLGVLFRPPVAQIAFSVELAALVVKAVCQFVSDGAAGVAVIGSIIELSIVG